MTSISLRDVTSRSTTKGMDGGNGHHCVLVVGTSSRYSGTSIWLISSKTAILYLPQVHEEGEKEEDGDRDMAKCLLFFRFPCVKKVVIMKRKGGGRGVKLHIGLAPDQTTITINS